jgi:hypothetical protein
LWLVINLISTSRSVSLYKMKDFVGGILGNKDTSSESPYKRLIRFINEWSKKKGFKENLLRHNVRLLRARGFDTLLLDGTSWRFGQQKIHYLVLSIVVHKVSIPIFWKRMGEMGASSQDDRIQLFDEAAKFSTSWPHSDMVVYLQ